MTSAAAGRPRDPAIDSAVVAATLQLLREGGYAGFAMETVAAMAGTTKASIRRRWPVRQNLIIDALATVVIPPEPPDNACTRCDLIQSVRLLSQTLNDQLPPRVLAPLLAACESQPQLHHRLVEALIQPSRSAATVAVRRAVDRGDLRKDTDPALLVDQLASTVYQRALFGDTPVDKQSAGQLVDQLLRGVAVDFDRLLWISRQPAHARPGNEQHE